MKELCEPRVKPEISSNFSDKCSLRWPPQSVSGVDILAGICWIPHSQCLEMISWLTYVRPPPTQKIVSVRR